LHSLESVLATTSKRWTGALESRYEAGLSFCVDVYSWQWRYAALNGRVAHGYLACVPAPV